LREDLTRRKLTKFSTPTAGCGIVGYTKDTAAYFFDSSGTKNTFAACGAACKADAQCKSFGYGEANCLLFTVDAYVLTLYPIADTPSNEIPVPRTLITTHRHPTPFTTKPAPLSSPSARTNARSPSHSVSADLRKSLRLARA